MASKFSSKMLKVILVVDQGSCHEIKTLIQKTSSRFGSVAAVVWPGKCKCQCDKCEKCVFLDQEVPLLADTVYAAVHMLNEGGEVSKERVLILYGAVMRIDDKEDWLGDIDSAIDSGAVVLAHSMTPGELWAYSGLRRREDFPLLSLSKQATRVQRLTKSMQVYAVVADVTNLTKLLMTPDACGRQLDMTLQSWLSVLGRERVSLALPMRCRVSAEETMAPALACLAVPLHRACVRRISFLLDAVPCSFLISWMKEVGPVVLLSWVLVACIALWVLPLLLVRRISTAWQTSTMIVTNRQLLRRILQCVVDVLDG